MELRAVGKSDVGLKRKLNEDSYIIASDLGLYVIADGMGGHKAGEVASRMAVETISDYWRKLRDNNPPSFLVPIKGDYTEKAKHLVNSIILTNIIVHEAQKKPEYLKMGSTVSALIVEKDCIWCANVGDSPVYLFEQGRLVQISEEHSIEAEQKKYGTGGKRTLWFQQSSPQEYLNQGTGTECKSGCIYHPRSGPTRVT